MPSKFTEILEPGFQSTSPRADVRLEDIIGAADLSQRARTSSEASSRSESSSSSERVGVSTRKRLSKLLSGSKRWTVKQNYKTSIQKAFFTSHGPSIDMVHHTKRNITSIRAWIPFTTQKPFLLGALIWCICHSSISRAESWLSALHTRIYETMGIGKICMFCTRLFRSISQAWNTSVTLIVEIWVKGSGTQ